MKYLRSPPEYFPDGLRDDQVAAQPAAHLPQPDPVSGGQIIAEIGKQNLVRLNLKTLH